MLASVCSNGGHKWSLFVATAINSMLYDIVLSAHVHRALWDQIRREREERKGEGEREGKRGGWERDNSNISSVN